MSAPRHANGRPRGEAGFTLMEVLVALAIMTAIMAMLYTVLHTSLRTRDQLDYEARAARVGPFLLDAIEADLTRAWIGNIEGDRVLLGENRTIDGEDADSLVFLATVDSTLTHAVGQREVASDVCETGYRLRANPDLPDRLELWRRQDFHVDDEPLEGGTYERLYDRVISFRLRYLDELRRDADEHESWDTSKRHRLPAAVRIELEIELAGPTLDDLDPLHRGARVLRYHRVLPLQRDSAVAMRVHPLPPAFEAAGSGPGTPGSDDDGEGDEDDIDILGPDGQPGGGG